MEKTNNNWFRLRVDTPIWLKGLNNFGADYGREGADGEHTTIRRWNKQTIKTQ
jgi:hypothetical protein